MRRAFAGLLAGAVAAAGGAALPAAAGAAAPALPDGRAYELVSPLEARSLSFDSHAWPVGDGDRAVMQSVGDIASVYVASRGERGWTTERVRTIPPGATLDNSGIVHDSAPDGSRLLVSHGSVANPFLTDRLALRQASGSWATVGEGVMLRGASTDLDRIVVAPWAPENPYPDVPSASGVYLWDDGEVSSIGDDAEAIAACGADVADGASHTQDQDGVAADGRTIVLLSRACTRDGTTYRAHVHVWREGRTADVSVPVAGADADAAYAGNAVDGSAVFLTTTAQLAPGDDDGDADLYRYDVEDAELTRVSAGPAGPVVEAIASDDGRSAWFVTRDGDDALHHWSAGAAADEIASGPSDAFDFVTPVAQSERQTQLTPDGRTLAWLTTGAIGGSAGGGEPQIVRATADGDLACVSCQADGTGAASVAFGSSPDNDGLRTALRSISDDGAFLFFEARSALLPADENGRADVYGWHDGTLSLITSGTHAEDAALASVSPRGDVFFRTGENLLPWLESDHVKVYVARRGGGFPAPQSPLPGCTGEDCQGPPRAPEPPASPHDSEGDRGGETDDPESRWAADPAVRLGAVSKAAKQRLARGRTIGLRVRATASGRVTATLQVKRGRRWIRAGSAARTVKRAGRTTLTVKLGRSARTTLARRGSLRVRIVVAHARGTRDATTSFVLRTKTTAGRRAHA